MGWGDIMAGIGSAAEGVNRTWQYEKDRKQRESLAQQQNELREMLAQVSAKSKTDVAEIGAQAKRDVAERNAAAKITVQELANIGDLDEVNSKGEWEEKVQKLRNAGKINEVEAMNLNRLQLAEVNRQIQAAHDKAGITRSNIGANARVQSAGIAASASRDVAQTHEGGKNYRFNTSFPLDVYKAQTNAQRPRAPSPYGAPIGQPQPQPMVPSYGDFMQNAPSMTPSPPSGAPLSGPQSFSFGKPAGPSPVGPQPQPPMNFPPPLPSTPTGAPAPSGFGPSEMMSSLVGGAQPTAPAAPPRDMPAPLPSEAGSAFAQPGAQQPLPSRESFWSNLQPVPGRTSAMSEDRIEQQADDIMRRMELAKKTGDRKAWSSLRQQLADMLQNQ